MRSDRSSEPESRNVLTDPDSPPKSPRDGNGAERRGGDCDLVHRNSNSQRGERLQVWGAPRRCPRYLPLAVPALPRPAGPRRLGPDVCPTWTADLHCGISRTSTGQAAQRHFGHTSSLPAA